MSIPRSAARTDGRARRDLSNVGARLARTAPIANARVRLGCAPAAEHLVEGLGCEAGVVDRGSGKGTRLGVDGQENGCMMCGSVTTKGCHEWGRKASHPRSSLTVCAGILCGRLAVDGSPTYYERPSKIQAKAISHSLKRLGLNVQEQAEGATPRVRRFN